MVRFKDFSLVVGSDGFKTEIGGQIHFFIPEGGQATFFEGLGSEGFAREFFKPFPEDSTFGFPRFGEAEITDVSTDFNVPFSLIEQAPSFLIPNLPAGYIASLEASQKFIEGEKHDAQVAINQVDLPLGVDISSPEDNFIGSSSFVFRLEADLEITEFKASGGFQRHFFPDGQADSFFIHFLDNDLWGTQALEDAKDQRLDEFRDLQNFSRLEPTELNITSGCDSLF